MNGIWAIGLTDFIIYACLNVTLTKQKEFHILWDINFAQQCLILILFIATVVMFLMTLLRVIKIDKAVKHPENAKYLKRWKKIIAIAFLAQLTFVLANCTGLYLQGYFGPWARIQAYTTSSLVLINEIIFFVLIVNTYPDCTLNTKVLNDSRLVLVGIDRRNYERFKLYIPRTRDGGLDGN